MLGLSAAEEDELLLLTRVVRSDGGRVRPVILTLRVRGPRGVLACDLAIASSSSSPLFVASALLFASLSLIASLNSSAICASVSSSFISALIAGSVCASLLIAFFIMSRKLLTHAAART
ncbi:MAG: hypothetical protein IJM45_07625 [Clostridia bacterium]|nr:hypothetical protein [Clostridia bacterium]